MKTQSSKQNANVVAVQPLTAFHGNDASSAPTRSETRKTETQVNRVHTFVQNACTPKAAPLATCLLGDSAGTRTLQPPWTQKLVSMDPAKVAVTAPLYRGPSRLKLAELLPRSDCRERGARVGPASFQATYLLTVVLLLALAATPSFANSILIHSTGEGLGSGGILDPNYMLIGGGPYGNLPPSLFTTPPFLSGGWVAPPTGTQWVNPSGNTLEADNGEYDYQTTFSLAGLNPTTAILTGEFAADNDACISLNGSPTGACTADPCGFQFCGFEELTPFTIGPCPGGPNCGLVGFLPGKNTLDFFVYNLPVSPTGLVVTINGTASSTTPEPPSLVIFGSGVLGVAGLLRRKVNL